MPERLAQWVLSGGVPDCPCGPERHVVGAYFRLLCRLVADPPQPQSNSLALAFRRHPIHRLERYSHQLGERLEVAKRGVGQAERVHEHERPFRSVSLRLIDCRGGAVEKLATDIPNIGNPQTERYAKGLQSTLLSGAVIVPGRDEFAERLVRLPFDRDDCVVVGEVHEGFRSVWLRPPRAFAGRGNARTGPRHRPGQRVSARIVSAGVHDRPRTEGGMRIRVDAGNPGEPQPADGQRVQQKRRVALRSEQVERSLILLREVRAITLLARAWRSAFLGVEEATRRLGASAPTKRCSRSE